MNCKPFIIIESSLKRLFILLCTSEGNFFKITNVEKGLESIIPKSLDEVLLKSKLNLSEIRMILVSKGPGSFTGIRVGISAAIALGISNNIPVIGYSNHYALLQEFLLIKQKFKSVMTLISAGAGSYYMQIYNTDNLFLEESVVINKQQIMKLDVRPIILASNNIQDLNIANSIETLPSSEALYSLSKTFIKKHFEKGGENNYNGAPIPLYVKDHYAKTSKQL